jgi:3,4-dihydroxy 2-butanone 4-phosphate synthase/GTP cyclohydrolase II
MVMALNKIEEIIDDMRRGKMVILMDDEDRENEGDIIVAAEKITPEIINFMATEARGLICLTLTGERCDFLGLPAMVAGNGAKFSTPFTVSIEAAEGVTTGISAADRAKTIRVAVDNNSTVEDIVQPGHIFPLRARPGGVLSRAGHTEAGCDLARLAGLTASSAIVEIMNADGTMSRRPDLEIFAEKHDIKIGTIADLIHYRMANEKTIDAVASETINTEFGEFRMHKFVDTIQGETHIALTKGNIKADVPCIVRVQTGDFLRDILNAVKPGTQSWSSQAALKKIADEGTGALVLLSAGIAENVSSSLNFYLGKSKPAKSPNVDSSGAFLTIGTGSQILREIGVQKMRLLSSPVKYPAISGFDLEVIEYIPYEA